MARAFDIKPLDATFGAVVTGIELASLDDATWQKLFIDVTPEDLAQKGKTFPITPYFNDILEAYERKVQ